MSRRSTATATATTEAPKTPVVPPRGEDKNLPAAPAQRSLGGVNDRNAFESYGDQAGGGNNIVGSLLKFSKGDWLAGEDQEDVDVGTQFVANMDQLLIGWIKWQENKPVEQIMGPVAEGFQPPRRNTLGDEDEDQWEVDEATQKPRDPWQFSNYMLMAAVGNNDNADEDELFTFATSSRGGLGAIGDLCKVYGKEMRQRPDEYPIVEIGTNHYQHSNPAYGRIYVPTFKVVGWKPKADFPDSASATEAVEEAPKGNKKTGGKKK